MSGPYQILTSICRHMFDRHWFSLSHQTAGLVYLMVRFMPRPIFVQLASRSSVGLFSVISLPTLVFDEFADIGGCLGKPYKICYTVKPLSYHKTRHIFGFFQTGGCSLLNESSTESSCWLIGVLSFLCYFHSAISNHLSIAISMSPEWMVA